MRRPSKPLDDANARTSCGATLALNADLRDTMNEPFMWGQQSHLWDYEPLDFRTTRFNPLVFRRMYLSLFMFTGSSRRLRAPLMVKPCS